MIHWLILHIALTFFHSRIGTEQYCAFDWQTRKWECNYVTAGDCVQYNDYCGERYGR